MSKYVTAGWSRRWPECWAALVWIWESWRRPAGADAVWEQNPAVRGSKEKPVSLKVISRVEDSDRKM